ncbi:MAG: rod shape-determining protein MreD [Polyangiales bacterium]
MQGFRSSFLIILIAYALLLAQSVFARVLAPYPFSPYLVLPLVFAVGVAPGVSVVRGAATAFILGYLFDVFTGNPVGIHTFVFVVAYFASRLAGYLMSFRGITFEIGLTFALTLLVGGLIELIRRVTPGGMTWGGGALALSLFGSAFSTAVVAPILFAIVRRADPTSVRASA